ncbi:hypothetical protein FRC08_008760 [Ceratobasidium sp. 394]|nr:hypothetical protein FRC08_008760 [Ceratobasidium sp. 394]
MYAHPQVPRRISGEMSDVAYGYPAHENYRPASSPSYPQQGSYDRYHQDGPSYHHHYGEHPRTSHREAGSGSPVRDRHAHRSRYSPYPSASRRDYAGAQGGYRHPPGEYEYPSSGHALHSRSSDSNLRHAHDPHERLTLPPISALAPNLPSPRGAFTLPPLVAPATSASRSSANGSDVPILGRMRLNSADDTEDIPRPSEAYLQQRRSSSAPPLHLAPNRYPLPPRSGDRLDDTRAGVRPLWSFGSSDRGTGLYERDSHPETRRSDTFAWSSVRGGPSTSPPPSTSNSTHGALSTNEHSPISPRTPYGWESSRVAPPSVSGRSVDHPVIQRGSPRERSRSPEISVAQDYEDDHRSALEASRRSNSPSHSRKSSGHGSNQTETMQAARAPLRPW